MKPSRPSILPALWENKREREKGKDRALPGWLYEGAGGEIVNDYTDTKQWNALVEKVANMVIEIMHDPEAPDWDEVLTEFADAVEEKIDQL